MMTPPLRYDKHPANLNLLAAIPLCYISSVDKCIYCNTPTCNCIKNVMEVKSKCLTLLEIFSTTLKMFVCLFVLSATAPHWTRASSFTRFLDHTKQRTTIGRTPLGERSARRRDLYVPDNIRGPI